MKERKAIKVSNNDKVTSQAHITGVIDMRVNLYQLYALI